MHDAERSSLGELVSKVVEKGRDDGTFAFHLVFDEAGDWHAAYTPPIGTDVTTVHSRTAVDVLKSLCRALGLLPDYAIRLRNDRTDEVKILQPIWSVLIEMSHLRYVHLGIEADDAQAAASKVLETHKDSNSLHGAEVYVYPNATMESYIVQQDTSFELVAQ